jgi:KDO2-lipid IV(A) lauroyltransferase
MRGRFRTTKRLLFFGAVRLLKLIAAVLPRRATFAVFGAIARVAHRIDRPAVRRSHAHLEKAFGRGLSADARDEIVEGMFRVFGHNLVDLLRPRPFVGDRPEAIVDAEGLEHLRRPLDEGRGVVALSAHFGNWELLGAALTAWGFPLHVLAARLFDPRSDRLLNRWRRARGVRVHHRDGGLAPLVSALRSGEIVGALVDQDGPGRGIFVGFFGSPARTSVGPFVLAARTGAALVPVLIHLDADGRHRIRVSPELVPRAELAGLERVRDLVTRWHAVLESAIREHPEQWVWHHRRWRSRPAGSADLRESSKERPYLPSFQNSRSRVFAR